MFLGFVLRPETHVAVSHSRFGKTLQKNNFRFLLIDFSTDRLGISNQKRLVKHKKDRKRGRN